MDTFNGKLVHEGKPVTFPDDQQVQLKLFHEKGESFGIPIQPDGTFKIGWMPVGKYSATLTKVSKTAKKGQSTYTVPGGLTIEEGKAEYTIDLGKNWKP